MSFQVTISPGSLIQHTITRHALPINRNHIHARPALFGLFDSKTNTLGYCRFYSSKPPSHNDYGARITVTKPRQISEKDERDRGDNEINTYHREYFDIFSRGLETSDNDENESKNDLTEVLRERQYAAYRDMLTGGNSSSPAERTRSLSRDEDNTQVFSQLRAEEKDGIALTHTDTEGKARMVDVGDKPETSRTAIAEGVITLGQPAFSMVEENKIKKGDVLSVAQIAGIMAAKRTSSLIPLCHDLQLTKVNIDFRLDWKSCRIVATSEVRTHGQTGVEMEALTAVSVSLLTIYDMCKAVTHDIIISDVRLMSKTGGQRGTFNRERS